MLMTTQEIFMSMCGIIGSRRWILFPRWLLTWWAQETTNSHACTPSVRSTRPTSRPSIIDSGIHHGRANSMASNNALVGCLDRRAAPTRPCSTASITRWLISYRSARRRTILTRKTTVGLEQHNTNPDIQQALRLEIRRSANVVGERSQEGCKSA